MSKVLAINGSARKNGNTARLLQKALEGAAAAGAETELIHLSDLKYSGCTSCFACKRKGTKYIGACAVKDDLQPVLEKAMACDTLLLGSPIYIGDISASMRAFLERFSFMNVSYNDSSRTHFKGKKNGAFFYTMNVPRAVALFYGYVFLFNTAVLKSFHGKVRQLVSTDTLQFDDYSKFEAANYNETKKKKRHETVFPRDERKAYEIGRSLV